jgi:hypothetical protein
MTDRARTAGSGLDIPNPARDSTAWFSAVPQRRPKGDAPGHLRLPLA